MLINLIKKNISSFLYLKIEIKSETDREINISRFIINIDSMKKIQ